MAGGTQSAAPDPPPLAFTGERFTPECVREMHYEHWHRYAWAAALVAGRDVLDCACGEGYGSRLLAESAASVSGVDIDPATVEHARARYGQENLEFHAASALSLPFDDDRFDSVVSFETLEHLAEHDALMQEFRRVLKPSGFVLISSPDRKTYSDDTGYVNEFHVRELYRDEFEDLLGRYFPNYRLFGQKLMFHSTLWALDDADGPARFITEDAGRPRACDRPGHAPIYFLAAAAAEPAALPAIDPVSLFDDRSESVYQHYNEEVGKHIQAGQLLAERDAEIEALKARLAERKTRPAARESRLGRLARLLFRK